MLGERSHGSLPVVCRVVVDEEKVLDSLPQMVLDSGNISASFLKIPTTTRKKRSESLAIAHSFSL
jgi:hypothetical protein